MPDAKGAGDVLHAQFDTFVPLVGGVLVRDLITPGPNDPDNADYFFQEDAIVAELKVLETDRTQDDSIDVKVQAKFAEWQASGRLPGIAYGAPVVPSTALPQRLQWELQRIHSEPIRRLIKKANTQIKQTKLDLEQPAAKGLLLLINEGDYSQRPDYLTYAVHQSLLNDFSSIHTVVVMTVTLVVRPSQSAAPFRFWIEYRRDTTNKVGEVFMQRLRGAWAHYLSTQLGITMPLVEPTNPIDLSTLRYDEPTQ